MFRVPFIFAAFGLFLFTVFGTPILTDQEMRPSQLAKTKEIFKDRCQRCHGIDGRGQTDLGARLHVPDFTSEAWPEPGVTDSELSATIRAGKDEMPAFGKKLTRDEIKNLVSYIRSLKNREAKP